MTKFLVSFINIYQKFLSPDHSFWAKERFPHGYCRFYPSCSEYSRQSILKYGFFEGIFKSLWRVVRCNPFSKGGWERV
ncbi:MAG: membrane protein insertion efficiency factor YidD [bacterium]|nr:membrane protein insertion efficiency factor YidD [bacterium]